MHLAALHDYLIWHPAGILAARMSRNTVAGLWFLAVLGFVVVFTLFLSLAERWWIEKPSKAQTSRKLQRCLRRVHNTLRVVAFVSVVVLINFDPFHRLKPFGDRTARCQFAALCLGLIFTGLVVWWRKISYSRWLALAGTSLVMVSVGSFALEEYCDPRMAIDVTVCRHNLPQIGLALRNYCDDQGAFPPPYLCDAEGKPMHSWRVLILPYFNNARLTELYNSYNFDEPWDGPNNRQLHRPVWQYRCPAAWRTDPQTTNRLAVVGEETAWRPAGEDGRPRPVKLRQITDGTSWTLLLVEDADSGIHWMEPVDLVYSPHFGVVNPKTGRRGIHGRDFGGLTSSGVFADGGIINLPNHVEAETLKPYLTRAGGEAIAANDRAALGSWVWKERARRSRMRSLQRKLPMLIALLLTLEALVCWSRGLRSVRG